MDVVIIGFGSRGLGVLERLVTLAKRRGRDGSPALAVDVVDPTCVGAGVHDRVQPDYLLLNTTCANVSLFPDHHTVGSDVDEAGPSLFEWATDRGLRLGPDGYTVSQVGREIRPTDFLPRRLLGEYLAWFAEQLVRKGQGHVEIRLHRAEAVDLIEGTDGALAVLLSDGTTLRSDFAFLTTGYTANLAAPPERGLVDGPYPLPARVGMIGSGETVAVGGFGLSAMDLMSSLTVGRGGQFVDTGSALRYVASGREPRLLFFSRTGVPCRARPLVMELGPPHDPVAFTPAAIDALRLDRDGGPLDFETDVLPLILTEVRVAYRVAQARLTGAAAEIALADRLARVAGPAELIEVLDDLDGTLGRSHPGAALDGSAEMALEDTDAYQGWLADTLRTDLAEGRRGFAGSPLKAGLDVLRALRDTFRYVIDFGGLTAESLDEFHRHMVPAINRAVVGPQFERHAEFLALMDVGIIRTPVGPDPRLARDGAGWTLTSTRLERPATARADWLVRAQVSLPAVAESASPLLSSLFRRGWIRRHRVDSAWVSGIDVDRHQHPLDVDGQPRRRIFVLGPLCEGATFYNNLVPSPNMYSRPVADAHRCAVEVLSNTAQILDDFRAYGPHNHPRSPRRSPAR